MALFTFKESAGSLSTVFGFFPAGSEVLFSASYYGDTPRLLVGSLGLEGVLTLDGTASLDASPSGSSLLPLADGYLLAVYGLFCADEECAGKEYATSLRFRRRAPGAPASTTLTLPTGSSTTAVRFTSTPPEALTLPFLTLKTVPFSQSKSQPLTVVQLESEVSGLTTAGFTCTEPLRRGGFF